MGLSEKVEVLEKEIQKLKKVLGNQTTDVVVVLDRSGSMNTNKSDHEGGLRAFVEQQKSEKDADKVRFTFIQFDDQNPCEVIYDRVKLDKVSELTLHPRGMTPLRDAIGRSIVHLEDKASGDVLFLIISDGEENCSREWTGDALKSKIKEMEDKGWQFTFLGTNFDALTVGNDLGFDFNKAANFGNNSVGIKNSYTNVSNKMSGFRSVRASGASISEASVSLDFCESDRELLKGE